MILMQVLLWGWWEGEILHSGAKQGLLQMQVASAASVGALGILALPRICFGLFALVIFFPVVLVVFHEPFGEALTSQMSGARMVLHCSPALFLEWGETPLCGGSHRAQLL